jgi:hypothetical protein
MASYGALECADFNGASLENAAVNDLRAGRRDRFARKAGQATFWRFGVAFNMWAAIPTVKEIS